MLAVAVALIVIAVLFTLFGAIWVSIPAGIVGLALLIAFLVGIGRRADRAQEPGP